MYWTGKSINNLLSYCGLIDVRINASDKDLPVLNGNGGVYFAYVVSKWVVAGLVLRNLLSVKYWECFEFYLN